MIWKAGLICTAHDLAAEGSWEDNFNFRVVGGRRIWTLATYARYKVKLGSWSSASDVVGGPQYRYVDPDTKVILVPK